MYIGRDNAGEFDHTESDASLVLRHINFQSSVLVRLNGLLTAEYCTFNGVLNIQDRHNMNTQGYNLPLDQNRIKFHG